MKTKLLKELRSEAYKAYGIKAKLPLPANVYPSRDVDGVYIIGQRLSSEHDMVEFELKTAKKRLNSLRNEYCVRRVAELRESCRINRLNKL